MCLYGEFWESCRVVSMLLSKEKLMLRVSNFILSVLLTSSCTLDFFCGLSETVSMLFVAVVASKDLVYAKIFLQIVDKI